MKPHSVMECDTMKPGRWLAMFKRNAISLIFKTEEQNLPLHGMTLLRAVIFKQIHYVTILDILQRKYGGRNAIIFLHIQDSCTRW
jgi:hypothetical protein